MSEVISNISKVIENKEDNKIHKLVIETLRDNRTSYIAINVPNKSYYQVGTISIIPRFICDIELNFSLVKDYTKLIR